MKEEAMNWRQSGQDLDLAFFLCSFHWNYFTTKVTGHIIERFWDQMR